MNRPEATTILIVDDEPDIREVLAITLADMGYGIVEAEDADEAFAVFVKEQPGIVITDIKMPGGDGIGLLRKIKSENPETEVIMITGHGDMDLAIRSLKYAATDFITKPINVDALEIALRRAQEKIAMRQTLLDYTRNLERLIKEKTELQDHLASLGLMIGSISHGIKGLITSLDGGLYLVSSGLERSDPERMHQGCKAARETAERIRKMVLDILYYAKEREPKRTEVDAAAFARQVAAAARSRLDGSAVRFDCRIDADAGRMIVDADDLHAALINILENAVDACLREGRRSTHGITFTMTGRQDEIVFVIADDGTGMDKATRDQLFTLFFSTKGRKGTGLGLFITHRIVGQHAGEIAVTSTPGTGSEFTVRIPREPPSD
jgi:signal transduction histidine kinase